MENYYFWLNAESNLNGQKGITLYRKNESDRGSNFDGEEIASISYESLGVADDTPDDDAWELVNAWVKEVSDDPKAIDYEVN